MISNVCLIRPYSEGKIEFPFGLLFVGTALKRAGIKTEIIDLHLDRLQENEVIERVKNTPGLMIGISALSGSYFWVKEFVKKIKTISPETIVVIGGHIASSPELLLKSVGADYVCLAEGEGMMPKFITCLNQNLSLDNVPGVAYLHDDNVIRTGIKLIDPQNFLKPDFSLINVEKYLIHPKQDKFFAKNERYRQRSKDDDKMATIIFSRGCLGGCNFCYRHIAGYRQGEIDWCWDYLMELYDKYQVRYFRIDDELFTSNLDWFDRFYQKVIDSKIDILFRITGLRVDSVNDTLLEKLKKMGCIAVNFGIESGSQKILDKMNKRTTVDQNRRAIELAIKHDLNPMAYIMFGYPGETRQTLLETLDLLVSTRINPDKVSIFYTLPLPGTILFKDCRKNSQIQDEENFLNQLYSKIDSQHQRYLIQLGELNLNELEGFEKKFIFFINLKEYISYRSHIFKLIRKSALLIPDSSRMNDIFPLAARIMRKISKILPHYAR